MKKAILEFDLQENEDAFRRAISADAVYAALWEIGQEVFRPARKHGYFNDSELNELCENEAVLKAIGLLESKFHEILRDHEINLTLSL